MKILVAGLVKNIQLKRLQEEAEKLGHILDGCYASDLIIKASTNSFEVSLKSDLKKLGFRRGEVFGGDTCDLLYLMVSKRRWEWYVAANYLHKNYRTLVVNQRAVDLSYQMFLTPASDYLRQREDNLPFPKSAVIFSSESIELVEDWIKYPMVVKPVSGRQGRDVYKVGKRSEFLDVAGRIFEKSYALVVREFIENDGDVRVFTVGYKAIGAMKRIPPKGDFRSNISLGGRGEEFDLGSAPQVRKLAERVSYVTKTEIAGVDIIIDKLSGKPYILEVNPGPQFEGLEKYTGVNAALEIIKYFEKLYILAGEKDV